MDVCIYIHGNAFPLIIEDHNVGTILDCTDAMKGVPFIRLWLCYRFALNLSIVSLAMRT
jgi:hypothetical protein